jgi:hypothetical protein
MYPLMVFKILLPRGVGAKIKCKVKYQNTTIVTTIAFILVLHFPLISIAIPNL